ncbi:hypothetical protein KP509_37G009700 [Ceratopteris richardii]|uniref:X8 domain-containing protein n=1 Tax=Ceratopteris richardii TaxID=49495 RepID=A0A8T2Q5H8_CERRI|nr:hypothetical protein KP509_37G009700 [Ceratopteris richardii]
MAFPAQILLCFSFFYVAALAYGYNDNTNGRGGDSQGTGQKLWCVANPSVPEEELSKNLNFACGEGGANCKALEPGGPCYQPNSVIAHASYAMNLYYQAHGRNYWNCYFHDTGLVVFTDPSYGSCKYPAQ